MGIYNRNGMIASLNESTRGFGPIEVCETFTVGDDLGWSCAKVCASIEEASNEWMREIGMEELEHATVFGEELIYEADDASAKINKSKFMAFISSIKNAVIKFFKTLREKISAFFSKFKKKKSSTSAEDIEKSIRRKAADMIADEEAPMFCKTITEVDNYLNLVSTNTIKEEVVDKFIEDLEYLEDEIMSIGNKKIDDEYKYGYKSIDSQDVYKKMKEMNDKRDEAKAKLKERNFDNDDVNTATGKSDSKFMAKYAKFKNKWVDNPETTRYVIGKMLLSDSDVIKLNSSIGDSDNSNLSAVLKLIYTGDDKKKIGNIMDNNSNTPWSIETMAATNKAIENNIESQLNEAMGKLQKQFDEIIDEVSTRAGRLSETNLVAATQGYMRMVSQMYMAAASAFTESAISYLTYNKTLWNKFLAAIEKVKSGNGEGEKEGSENKSTNEGYNFFGAFESIR